MPRLQWEDGDEAGGYYEVICFTIEGGARCPAYSERMEMRPVVIMK